MNGTFQTSETNKEQCLELKITACLQNSGVKITIISLTYSWYSWIIHCLVNGERTLFCKFSVTILVLYRCVCFWVSVHATTAVLKLQGTHGCDGIGHVWGYSIGCVCMFTVEISGSPTMEGIHVQGKWLTSHGGHSCTR